MPWCPKCKGEYRDEFTKCSDCDVYLVNELSNEDYYSEDDIKSWAKSTLLGYQSCDELCEVYEMPGRLQGWLHEVLEDNKIPYKIRITPGWHGSSQYSRYNETQTLYVEQQHETTVLSLINDYENADINIDEEDMIDDIENALPQIKCPSCGEMIDFDYPKCPLCGKRI